MIHVRAPSRLHFGLLAPAAATGRRFGGIGLMIREPGIALCMERTTVWSSTSSSAAKTQAIVDQLLAQKPAWARFPQNIVIEKMIRQHQGLGAGTQLALALASAINALYHVTPLPPEELARLTGRGNRSAIGVHGFTRGGLLVDGGKANNDRLAPLIARHDFPTEWPVVLVLPPWSAGLHGIAERTAFAKLAADAPGLDEAMPALCHLVLLDILPALLEKDHAAFGEALYQFNRRAGVCFQSIQGGAYASAEVAELVATIRGWGVPGVGQSSWGPATFAIAKDPEQANWIANRVRERYDFTTEQVLVTAADNEGAGIWTTRLLPSPGHPSCG